MGWCGVVGCGVVGCVVVGCGVVLLGVVKSPRTRCPCFPSFLDPRSVGTCVYVYVYVCDMCDMCPCALMRVGLSGISQNSEVVAVVAVAAAVGGPVQTHPSRTRTAYFPCPPSPPLHMHPLHLRRDDGCPRGE
jgi:hypothetical protein